LALPVRTELKDSCVAWTDLSILSLASAVTSISPSGRAEAEEVEVLEGAARGREKRLVEVEVEKKKNASVEFLESRLCFRHLFHNCNPRLVA